ncbi:MAG: DUF3224 domain-containing protein [Saprospiraceae bacterium]|nr:DUF3224 domain-containing protein [Saprospiraceae bacterium]MCB9321561.1 DUF3224 domain-containing protein [Lewinellaceae bacterium]
MEKSIAKGTFEVKMNPQSQEQIGLHTMGRYLLDKQFSGDLEAISTVEMLAAGTENGAGAYVAIERVTGKLNGREGTFILTHMGTRTKTSQELRVIVVPGCGTGDLSGLTGTMEIIIENKVHYYVFTYQIAN